MANSVTSPARVRMDEFWVMSVPLRSAHCMRLTEVGQVLAGQELTCFSASMPVHAGVVRHRDIYSPFTEIRMQRYVLLVALAALAACTQKSEPPPAQTAAEPAAAVEPAGEPSKKAAYAPDVPAGDYQLDRAHTTLLFRVSHMGFSNFT